VIESFYFSSLSSIDVDKSSVYINVFRSLTDFLLFFPKKFMMAVNCKGVMV
jgi:hypothetical protein